MCGNISCNIVSHLQRLVAVGIYRYRQMYDVKNLKCNVPIQDVNPLPI